jgi:hypothetical protein
MEFCLSTVSALVDLPWIVFIYGDFEDYYTISTSILGINRLNFSSGWPVVS